MKLTERDVRLVRDIALSHVLGRDQIINLGYFSSVSRCNRTLERLRAANLITTISTPFYGQRLSIAGTEAHEVVGEKIAKLLAFRKPTPRLLQHCLMVSEVRIALLRRGGTGWRFEPQLRHVFIWRGRRYDVRPDGLIQLNGELLLLEVDLGHVSAGKFREKIAGYVAYARSGIFLATYGDQAFRVLTLTTSEIRCAHLAALVADSDSFRFATFDEIGATAPGGWS